MTTLEMRCLGGLTFVQDGIPVPDLKSIKGQALLCYLAVSGKRFTRSALAGMFWTDIQENLALMNLRKVLFRLKPLSLYLLVDRETLSFNLDAPFSIDVIDFQAAAAAQSDPQRLQIAVSLYQGDFLDGFEYDEITLFSDWVRSQRARLRESVLVCLQTLVRHFAGQHNYTLAIQFARRQLQIESWNEEAHCELMRLLSLSGQRSAALKQYEMCQNILKEELGGEPSPTTLHLVQQIIAEKLEGYETGMTGVPHTLSLKSSETLQNLPSMTAPLIGRHHERTILTTYLADPQIRLVSIAGAGGMGKTHLALSLAHEIDAKHEWFEGVCFIPLGAVTTRQHLIIAVANSLNLTLSSTRDPERMLLSYLQDKNLLIILDNFEQLLSEADLLEKIIQAAPLCKMLITTRERTKLIQEWVLDLSGLTYSENMADAQGIDTDAVRLFLQCARQKLADFSLERNFKAVTRICEMVQGMPLALELAASWIRVMTPSEIADRIAQSYHTLTGDMRNLPERHQTIQAVFESSWQWMSTEEQSIMRNLSVFRAGFSLEAAKQVAGASLPVLSGLMNKSLLNRDSRSGETTRFEFHELIRQFAYDKLRVSGEAKIIHNLHLNYFLSLAEQAEQFWDTAQEGEWLKHLEIERGNLNAALSWALDQGETEILLRLNAALLTFWMYKSPIGDAISWVRTSLALDWDESNSAVLRSRAKVLNVGGYSAVMNSNFSLAQSQFEEGLALYSRLEDQREIAWSLRGCAFAAMLHGEYAKAQPYLERSLAICQEFQDEWGIAWSIYDLGYLALARKDLAKARPLLENAHRQFHQYGILWGEFRSLTALGDLMRGLEQWQQASTYYRDALVFQQQYQFSLFVAGIIEGLAQLILACGDFGHAARLFGAAQKRRDSIEMARWFPQEADYQRDLAILHEQLTDDEFTVGWMEGYTMSTAKSITYALEVVSSPI